MAGNEKIVCKYYDGKFAKPYESIITAGHSNLTIFLSDKNETLFWKYHSLKVQEKPEKGRPLIITNIDFPEARLVIENDILSKKLLKHLPKSSKPLISISLSAPSIIFWSLCVITFLASGYYYLPKLIPNLVKNFPKSLEKKIGDYALASITDSNEVCNFNKEGQESLKKIVKNISDIKKIENEIEIIVINFNETNALALPGDKIIVFNGLINESKRQDELIGIIAHEMGHIIHKHPTQMLIRRLSFSILIKLIFNNAGEVSSIASTFEDLLSLKYSREFEKEADYTAVKILNASGVGVNGFVSFFEKLSLKEKDNNLSQFTKYLSTHPEIAERISYIKSQSNNTYNTNILTDKEWGYIKNICNR